MMNTTPHSTSLVKLIAESQALSHKSDEQIVKALGFNNTSVVTMIREGKMKLPIDKVPALAKALDIPVSDVLRCVLGDYMPEVLAVIDDVWPTKDMTANELKLIESFRFLAKGHDVTPILMGGENVIALVTA